MKNKTTQNYSGITICDSIVVSVKKRKKDLRKLESAIIAVIGFVSVIMSFLGMFELNFRLVPVLYAAVICSAFYIGVSVIGKKAVWAYIASVLVLITAVVKLFPKIRKGFKYVYNIIYSDSYRTEIDYYKHLKPENEEYFVTLFLIFCIWLLAAVIYFFTISKPNPVIAVAATFPIIEIGLYNGIELPVFWGMLTVAYWIAILAVTTIDIGEYSGGSGGFVRKGNLFFPKRQMRLKVTEKCAILLIAVVSIVTVITVAVMQITDYERSEKINQRRAAVKEAVNSFSMDDIASSMSALTESFGFTFEYESHKLGLNSRLSYKEVTDLVVTVDKQYNGAIYLKGYSGAVYDDNEWLELDDKTLNRYSNMFSNFKKYSVYPQDFVHTFTSSAYPEMSDMTIWIEHKRKKNKVYAPYGTANYEGLVYKNDTTISSKRKNNSEYSYKFIGTDDEYSLAMLDESIRNTYDADLITDEKWKTSIDNYCTDNNLYSYDKYFTADSEIAKTLISQNDMYSNGKLLMSTLIENDYREFVYENYLQIPESKDIEEVHNAFADIIDNGDCDTASEKLAMLNAIRERIHMMTKYSLSPGKTPANRDFVNYFLLENHKGYCTHYATAGVILSRMAGIPARYSTGYVVVGDDFNDDNKTKNGSYTIEIKDNRSHAWAEIYLDGFGWIPFEFTAGYSASTINTDTSTATDNSNTQTTTTTSKPNTTNTSKKTTQKKSSATTGKTNTITTVTTSSVTQGKGGFGSGDGDIQLTETQKNVLLILTTVVAVAAVVALRICLIRMIRKKHFNDSDKRKRICYIYNYTERILKTLDIQRENLSYSDFADFVESRLSGTYFRQNDFRSLIMIALNSSFGKDIPDASETKFAAQFADDFAHMVYSKSGLFRKIHLRFILVLV